MGSRLLVVLAGALFGVCASASTKMPSYPLQALQPTAKSYAQWQTEADLLVFFEPDCSWCFKQVRVLNERQRICPSFQALAIGINGSRRALREELRRLRPEFPAFEASARMLEDLGSVPGTPLMIYLRDGGHFVSFSRGYQDQLKLDGILQALDLHECDINTLSGNG